LGSLLLLAEIPEAVNDALVILVVAALILLPVNGLTLLELLKVSDTAIVTLLLQVRGFDPANGHGCNECERQQADD
jgi:hypothetical protein